MTSRPSWTTTRRRSCPARSRFRSSRPADVGQSRQARGHVPRACPINEDAAVQTHEPTEAAAVEDTTSPAVELTGITKRFPGVVANSDVNITVRPGTVHALCGENGAGKSTLMKILYGMQQADEGTITVNGETVVFHNPADAIARGIGMVHQHFMLADNLTVLENVVLGAEKLYGIGAKARAKIKELSDAYGLNVRPDVLLEQLGAAAPPCRDALLSLLPRRAVPRLLDGPPAVLVPQEVDALFDNLRELKAEGLTVI